MTHLTGSQGQISFEPFGSELSLSTPDGERTVRLSESGRGVRGMVREFRSCIREGREPAMSGEDGLSDLAVVLAAYRSAEEGAEVAVSLP
jgi:predicted dehydrogenase